MMSHVITSELLQRIAPEAWQKWVEATKNWAVRFGTDYVEIEHIYDGHATSLTRGCAYTLRMPLEGAEVLVVELQEAIKSMRGE